MTRWLDPVQLVRTAGRVLTARHADRAREEGPAQQAPVARYESADGEDFWFDYVADLGDAFDPSMAVAWHLGRGTVPLEPDDEGLFPAPPPSGLPRGRFLVFGGDQVYPYATGRRYRDQTVGPYALAGEGDVEADVYALPGNHDWYGKLGPFRQTFCTGGAVGSWRGRQSASWFATQLPRGWWLWGIDTGLAGTINPAQRKYFADVGRQLQPGDRVILCTPVPLWVLHDRRPEERAEIEAFVRDVLGDNADIPLFLSGDAHLFAAAWRGGIGKALHLTSGGGGAFLHLTHHLLVDTRQPGQPEFQLIKAWPSAERSKALARPALRLVWDRQSRLLVPLLALLLLAYFRLATLGGPANGGPDGRSLPSWVARVASAPSGWPVLAAVLALSALTVGANTRTQLVRRAARRRGLLLGALQVALFILVAATGGFLADRWTTGQPGRVGVLSLAAVVGAVASLVVFGLFLGRANRKVDVADNLVFSARHLGRYKHFVRCRIDGRTGRLDVFVVGITDPGDGWAEAMAGTPRAPPASCSTPVYVWGRSIPARR